MTRQLHQAAVFGSTHPQLWSALPVAVGVALLAIGPLRDRPPAGCRQ